MLDSGFPLGTMCDQNTRKMVKIGKECAKIGTELVKIGTELVKLVKISTNWDKFSEKTEFGTKYR